MSNPDMRSFLTWLNTQRLLVLILFVLLFALAVRIPVDTDTFWHLRSGEWTLANRAVPQTDPFSITRGGQPWINQSWLSQLVLVAFYNGFAVAGLAFYTALLATAGMAFIFATCPGNVYLRGFIAILSAATAAVFWSARPQMMSFFLSTVTLYLLELYKRRGVNRLWLLPPLMILWVNLHSGFAIGFIFIGAYLGAEAVGRLFTPTKPGLLTGRQIGLLIGVALVSAAALMVNPYTIQMLTYPFRTAGIGSLQQYIQEWASPDFHGRETWPFLIMLFGVLAAVGWSKRGVDWSDLALVCGTAFMALIWQRNFAVFAVAAAPALARHLDYVLQDRGLVIPRPRKPRGAAVWLNWALLLLVTFGAVAKIAYTLNPTLVLQATVDTLPVRAVAWLNANNPAGPLFNTYNWGGYLLFAAPQYPVFVDGRTDLYDDKILNQWRLAMIGEGWRETFAQYDIRLVVIEKNAILAGTLEREPGWTKSYQDDQAVIFTRTGA